MGVRAKFHVTRVSLRGWSTEVELWPVSKGDAEDKAFWAATPSGKIEMTIKNETAAKMFWPLPDGTMREFYVDFTEVPQGVESKSEGS